jgi:hypothetical protein
MVSPLHLSRRTLVGAGLALPAAPMAQAAASGDLADMADAAFTFGIPLIEMAKVRGLAFGAGQRPGVFAGRRQLVVPAQRSVTMPNNDTVYASVFIDLRKGPAIFTVPQPTGRYASLQVMDFYSNNIAVVSPGSPLKAGETLRVVWQGAAAAPDDVVSPTPWIWALARVMVDGPADLGAALSVRDAYRLEAPTDVAAPPVNPSRSDDVFAQLASLRALLAENPPTAQDAAILPALKAMGLIGGNGFEPDRFDAAARVLIAAGVERAKARARESIASGRLIDGWYYSDPKTGVFGRDYRLRAAVATFGLAALPIREATYFRAAGPDGKASFDGSGPWVLRFAAGALPPVDAFWSATLYEPTPTGQYFLVENPIGRYAIGDRTPGLVYGRDGSLEIWIAREAPGPDRRANWLPAPATGPFTVVLRAYLPKPAIVEGRYRAPPIVPA